MLHSIRSKLLLAILAVTAVTVCSITVVFYFKSSRMIEDNYMDNLYARVEQTMNVLDDSLQEMYLISLKTAESEELKEQIESYKANTLGGDNAAAELDAISDILRDARKQFQDISSLYLILLEEKIAVTSEDYPVTKANLSEEGIEEIVETEKTEAVPVVLLDIVQENAGQLSCVQAVRGENGEILAYLLVNSLERTIYYKYLEAMYDSGISEAVILDKNKKIISSREYENAGEVFEGENLEGNGVSVGKNTQKLCMFYRSPFSNVGMYLEVLKSEVLKEMRQMQVFLMGMFALFLAVASILAICIARAMYRPIQIMTDTIEKVSGGDLSLRVEVMTEDEIGTLSQEFNEMLDHIEDLIHQVVEEERQKKDAELEALQYQITPHFLYNTLNSIKYAALIKGEKELGGLIGDFVELLQASINKKGTYLTVADEVHILKNYIRLQEFRYEGRFQVVFDIDEDALGCYIPRLILQPLVENALLHGMDMKEEKGELCIKGRVSEGVLTLSVSDNGRGMTAEQIDTLLSNKAKKTSGLSAIGIPNIKERLELYYEEKGGIQYESNEFGTTASIFLPANKINEI